MLDAATTTYTLPIGADFGVRSIVPCWPQSMHAQRENDTASAV